MSQRKPPPNKPEHTGDPNPEIIETEVATNHNIDKSIRFLPYLNIAAWIALVFGFVLVSYYCWDKCTSVYEDNYWSAHRMFFSHLLLSGNNLYSTTTTGAFQYHLYGPFYPIYFVPATLIQNYRHEVMVGTLMSFLALLVPLTLVFYTILRKNSKGAPLRYALVFAIVLMFYLFITQMSFVVFKLHVDSLAIGGSLLSLLCLARFHTHKSSVFYLLLSGFFLSISIYSKQTTALLVLLPLGYFLFARKDGTPRIKSLAYFFAPIVFIGLLILIHYGWDALYTNMLEMPKNQPLRRLDAFEHMFLHYYSKDMPLPLDMHQSIVEKIKILVHNTGYFITGNNLFCLILLVTVLSFFTKSENLRPGFLEKLFLSSLPILALTSILGYSKIGGDMSSMSYLLVFTYTLAIVRLVNYLSSDHFRFVKMGCIMLLPILKLGIDAYKDFSYNGDYTVRPTNGELVYDYCLKNPGTIYFPAYNFEQYKAEGALYPVSDSLYNFDLAGLVIQEDLLRKVLPHDIKYVVIDRWDPGCRTIHRLYENLYKDIPVLDFEELDDRLRNEGSAFFPSKREKH